MTSLGFSAVAEHAHRNQGRFPLLIPWIKELYRLTNTAGAFFRFKLIMNYIIINTCPVSNIGYHRLAHRLWNHGVKLQSLSPHEPFWTLIKIDLRLACGVTAAIEIPPVKGIVSQAVRIYIILKRAISATFSTILA